MAAVAASASFLASLNRFATRTCKPAWNQVHVSASVACVCVRVCCSFA